MPKKRKRVVMTNRMFLEIAEQLKEAIAERKTSLDEEVYISLEVCKDEDESTFGNRVHASEPILVGVVTRGCNDAYLHMQFIGEPNFKVY